MAAALKQNPVYRESGAEDIPTERLEQRVAEADPPIFVAILPDSARQPYGGVTKRLASEIVKRVQRNGTYMVISGTKWFAGSVRTLPEGRANALAEQAFTDHEGDPEAALLQWVGGVTSEASAAGSGATGQDETVGASQGGGDTSGGGAGGVIA
ncbi:MAG TPA: hypothetical protein VG409_16415, partial [Actinomycetota bacterium]|nr:hypothetical protein [Actinomycetota bacterium]